MKTVLLIVLALAIVSAQENPECEKIRLSIRRLRVTAKPGELQSVEAKVNEFKQQLEALKCRRTNVPLTRETEDKACQPIRDKIRNARLTISDPTELTAKVQEYIKQLDALRCAKRATPLPQRRGEPAECESLRAKIRQVRATSSSADKETADKKIAEYRARMDLIKCVNRQRQQRENPECQNIRSKIRLLRQNVRPGGLKEVESKVAEYRQRLQALGCRRVVRPINRQNENPRCQRIRQRIRIARLTIRDQAELTKKVDEYKKQLDSLKCAKDAVVPDARRNENPECSNLRAKIRALRATATSAADRSTVEKKAAEYRKRMDDLKCVRINRRRNQQTRQCVVTGCNGELCASSDQMSPCWAKPEFKCFAKHATCGNFGANGSCGWKKTAEFYTCSGERRN